VALAECCSGGMGALIDVAAGPRPEFALFHEGPSRVMLSTTQPETVEAIARRHNVECPRIGVTMPKMLRIDGDSATWIECPVEQLMDVWHNALERTLAPTHV